MVTLGLLASIAEGFGIGLLIPILDEVIGPRGSGDEPGLLAEQLAGLSDWIAPEYRLIVLGGAVIFLVALKTVIMIANTAVSAWVSSRISHDLRVAVADRVLRSDFAFVSAQEQGRLVNMLETQAYRLGEAMTVLGGLISAACAVVVFAVLLSLLSWQLALLVIAVILPVSFFVRAMTRRSRRLGERLVAAHSVLSARVLEMIGSMRTIRLFNGEPAEADRFARASDKVRRSIFRTGMLTGAIQPSVEFLYVPVFLVVLGYSLGMGIGLPVLFAFLALLYRLQTPLKRLDHARVALSSYRMAVEDLHDFLESSDRHPARTGRRQSLPIAEGIEFDHVSFQYAGAAEPALKDASLRIHRGDVVAITGASGSGKSTLVNLLCRLYEPTAGRILVDGVPLTELDARSWRDHVGFAGQDADLLDGSIRENVALGAPDAPDQAIERAIDQANASAFIATMPAGLDTRVGPRGRNLSGGQRQRIALARAFVRQPDLLILDEATNAVDSVTEAEIQQAIDALAGRVTILVIAHRLGTLRKADHAIVLEAGRIVEQGAPDEVLGAGGLLARQYALE
jgi:subfamily B ATP-binding cassette protein MsbA